MRRVAKEGDLSQGIDGPATPLTYFLQARKTFFGADISGSGRSRPGDSQDKRG